MKQALKIVVLTIVFIACILTYARLTRPGPLGDSFSLLDMNGNVITEVDIRAKPAIVFFGYTMCPDICPTVLYDLNQWLEKLGPDVNRLGVWYFTVDPERDSPEVMRDYILNFSTKIIGVSGDPEKVHAFVKSFNIVAEKVEGNNGDYTYDHTAAVILLRRGGELEGIIPYQEDEDIAVQQLRRLLERGG